MTQPPDLPPKAPLRLQAFRGVRYDPEIVGDVGAVTSPPYDVMDRRMIDALLNQHPRNIVRLILPRLVGNPATGGDPYRQAARRLRRWRHKGVLRADVRPALYLYEYGLDGHTVCGLVGALELRTRQQQVVLPHEDVVSGVVADRLALLRACQANLEPILLVYEGGGALTPLLDTIRARPPLTDVIASDATVHRLWSIVDPGELQAVEAALAPHQALIADGHHRYATYLRLQRRQREAGAGPGPWDRGLALLVDQSQSPLTLGAIHRSVCELTLAGLSVPAGYDLSEPGPIGAGVPAAANEGEFVVTDGSAARTIRLTRPDPAHDSDAERLQEVLLPSWGVTDDRVGFHHTTEQAVRTAQEDGGVAIVLHPAAVDQVMAVARAGKIMPRKSTSFGPKPRMGLVLRSFRDEQ